MYAFHVCAAGRVFALPEVVVDLMQAAGAGFSAGSLEGLEGFGGGHFLVLGRNARQIAFSRLTGPDSRVDLLRCLFPHLVRHVAVDVQGRGGIHVTDNGGERFHINDEIVVAGTFSTY